MKCLITPMIIAALMPAAFAATHSVPSQYSTIQAAVNAAASGDTISIVNGTFNRSGNVADNSSTFMRPWRAYGQSVVINCTADAHITAAGWSPWDGRELTCRAAEYGSKTPDGATINLSTRSSWVKRLTSAQAATYSKNNVLGGWVPPL